MANPMKLKRRIERTAMIATVPPVPGLLFPVESKTGAGEPGVAGVEGVGVEDGAKIGVGGGRKSEVEFGDAGEVPCRGGSAGGAGDFVGALGGSGGEELCGGVWELLVGLSGVGDGSGGGGLLCGGPSGGGEGEVLDGPDGGSGDGVCGGFFSGLLGGGGLFGGLAGGVGGDLVEGAGGAGEGGGGG